jgi:hypothetical protein
VFRLPSLSPNSVTASQPSVSLRDAASNRASASGKSVSSPPKK